TSRAESPHRHDEPYRRALIGVYGRLAATARELTRQNLARREASPQPAYASPDEFARNLQVLADSLVSQRAAPVLQLRLAALQQAIPIFGFHLATIDLRQSSDVHERTLTELFARAGEIDNYAALDEQERIALLRRELAHARPLVSPWFEYSDETARELAISQCAARLRRRYCNAIVYQAIIAPSATPAALPEVH